MLCDCTRPDCCAVFAIRFAPPPWIIPYGFRERHTDDDDCLHFGICMELSEKLAAVKKQIKRPTQKRWAVAKHLYEWSSVEFWPTTTHGASTTILSNLQLLRLWAMFGAYEAILPRPFLNSAADT